MNRFQFEVARLTFECFIPKGVNIQKFLFSLRPFMKEEITEDVIFSVVPSDEKPDTSMYVKLENFSNDMGDVCVFETDHGFVFSYTYDETGTTHYMITDRLFTRSNIVLDWNDSFATIAFSSMLRTLFSQAILRYDGISIHSSVISKDGYGYLFLGKSGTGKSTHTRLWLNSIPGTSLLNDDNPMLRFIDEDLYVFGSPWSGKTACYKNESAKVASLIRLEQAPINEFSQRTGIASWIEVFPSCSVLKESNELYDCFVKTLNRCVSQTIVGHLKCLPNKEAALLSEMSIRLLLEN